MMLFDDGYYDPDNQIDRYISYMLYTPSPGFRRVSPKLTQSGRLKQERHSSIKVYF